MTPRSLILLTAGLVLFVVRSIAHPEIVQEVRVEGTKRPLHLGVQAGKPFDQRLIEQEVRRLWRTGWFDDIQVRVDPDSPGVALTLIVQEKRRLYLRDLHVDPKGTRLRWKPEPGSPIDPLLARQFAAKLRRQFLEDGHVDAEVRVVLTPVGAALADLHLQVNRGSSYRVDEVQFAGSQGVKPKWLRKELRALRSRRILPGIPGFWKGWRLRPPFDKRRIEADIQRLRSSYLARGYLEARVHASQIELSESRATITMEVETGPRWQVKRVTTHGLENSELAMHADGRFPARELCHCLLKSRRKAEAEGRLDFSARIDIEPAGAAALGTQPVDGTPPVAASLPLVSRRSMTGLPREVYQGYPDQRAPDHASATSQEPVVNIAVFADSGSSYTVRRIDFRGHRDVSESTLRRALRLDEGEVLDLGSLRDGLTRLSRLPALEPLSEESVRIWPKPSTAEADLTIAVQERKSGHWSASGPLAPIALSGPLQFSLRKRLPSWGPALLDLSSYTAFVSLSSFSLPVWRVLDWRRESLWQPLIGVSRAYLPGREWRSGFVLSPQLGGKAMLAAYGMTQARERLSAFLELRTSSEAELAIPVFLRNRRESSIVHPHGYLLCASPQTRLTVLRRVAGFASHWLLASTY